MKVYRPTRPLLADVERFLAASKPYALHSPLENVAGLLCNGRHYSWVGIFLTVKAGSLCPQGAGNDSPGEMTLPETRSKILISMKLASREFGLLSVETDRENGFSLEDRIFLEGVADALARFLAGRGRYITRKAGTPNVGASAPLERQGPEH